MKDLPPVCFLLSTFEVGSVERAVIYLANACFTRGLTVRVVVLSAGRRNALLTEFHPAIDVAVLAGTWRQRLSEMRRLTRGSIVHIHHDEHGFPPDVRPMLAGRRLIVTYHALDSVLQARRTLLAAWCAVGAERVIAVSRAVAKTCARRLRVPATRIEVIAPAIPYDVVSPARTSDGPLQLVSFGNLTTHQNVGVLLEAMAIAVKNGAEAQLRIIGDGPMMAPLFDTSAKLGLRSLIEWCGGVWRLDMIRPLLATSDVLISTSRLESVSISLLHAMESSLAMLLSDVASHQEALGNAAHYFPTYCPSQLAELLRALAADRSQVLALQRQSRTRATHFDLDHCVDQHLALYASRPRRDTRDLSSRGD